MQRRLAEIMPGDIVVLDDARFKGTRVFTKVISRSLVGRVHLLSASSAILNTRRVTESYEANQHVGSQVSFLAHDNCQTTTFTYAPYRQLNLSATDWKTSKVGQLQ